MHMGIRFGSRSAGSGVTSSGGVTTGVSSQLIGPFKERQGCPPGSVVAHRYGSGLNRRVQCRVIQKAVSAPRPAPAPVAQQQVFKPTITVSPAIQTEVSPQVSPVFQQTGSGPQTAGTTFTKPGSQIAPTGPQTGASMADITALFQKQEEARARAEERRYQQQLEERRYQQQREEAQRQREAQMRPEQDAAMQPVSAPPPQAAPVTIPGAAILPAQVSTPAPAPPPVEQEIPWPLIAGGAIVLIGGVAYYMRKRKR